MAKPIVEYGHSLVERNPGERTRYLWCEACERAFLSMNELEARTPYCPR